MVNTGEENEERKPFVWLETHAPAQLVQANALTLSGQFLCRSLAYIYLFHELLHEARVHVARESNRS